MKRFLLFCFFVAPMLAAQSAEEILDRSVEAIGKKADLEKIESTFMKSSMSMPQGLNAVVSVYTKDGGKLFSETAITGPGMDTTMTMGCDGTDCYMDNPMMGRTLLEGQEKENALLSNDLLTMTDWRNFIVEYTYEGEGEVQGRKTYILKVKTKTGIEMTNHYDAENYRWVRSDSTVSGQMGTFQTVMTLSDFRASKGGLILPHSMVAEAMGQTMEMKVLEFEVNLPIPDSKFKLPEGLKEQ